MECACIFRIITATVQSLLGAPPEERQTLFRGKARGSCSSLMRLAWRAYPAVAYWLLWLLCGVLNSCLALCGQRERKVEP